MAQRVIAPSVLNRFHAPALFAWNGEDRDLIEQFDRFFEASRHHMLRAHPPDGRVAGQLRNSCQEAISVETGGDG